MIYREDVTEGRKPHPMLNDGTAIPIHMIPPRGRWAIKVGETSLAEAMAMIRYADAEAVRKAVEAGKWDAGRDGWINRDAATGEREGVFVSGSRPVGSGPDYRRAQEIVRRAR